MGCHAFWMGSQETFPLWMRHVIPCGAQWSLHPVFFLVMSVWRCVLAKHDVLRCLPQHLCPPSAHTTTFISVLCSKNQCGTVQLSKLFRWSSLVLIIPNRGTRIPAPSHRALIQLLYLTAYWKEIILSYKASLYVSLSLKFTAHSDGAHYISPHTPFMCSDALPPFS